jgi:arylsulfatase A-like enzyme
MVKKAFGEHHQPFSLTRRREKWTLFDEATRVPLLIYHPLSPFRGQQYANPVELIDIYPTLLDMAGIPFQSAAPNIPISDNCFHPGGRCPPLDGTSLAPVILGSDWKTDTSRRLNLTLGAPISQLLGLFGR